MGFFHQNSQVTEPTLAFKPRAQDLPTVMHLLFPPVCNESVCSVGVCAGLSVESWRAAVPRTTKHVQLLATCVYMHSITFFLIIILHTPSLLY